MDPVGIIPWEGYGNPLQHFCLINPWMNELGGSQSKVRKSQTRTITFKTKEKQTNKPKPKSNHTHTRTHTHNYPVTFGQLQLLLFSICSLNSNHIKLQVLTAKDNLFWLSYYTCCIFRCNGFLLSFNYLFLVPSFLSQL